MLIPQLLQHAASHAWGRGWPIRERIFLFARRRDGSPSDDWCLGQIVCGEPGAGTPVSVGREPFAGHFTCETWAGALSSPSACRSHCALACGSGLLWLMHEA